MLSRLYCLVVRHVATAAVCWLPVVSVVVLQALEANNYAGPYNSPAWLAQPVFIQSLEVYPMFCCAVLSLHCHTSPAVDESSYAGNPLYCWPDIGMFKCLNLCRHVSIYKLKQLSPKLCLHDGTVC